MKNNLDDLQESLYRTKQKINRQRENWSRPSSFEQDLQRLECAIYENIRLKNENKALEQQLAEENRIHENLQLQYAEWLELMGLFLDEMSQFDFEDYFRSYLIEAKTNSLEQRKVSKNIVTDLLANTQRRLPDDILDLLEHLLD